MATVLIIDDHEVTRMGLKLVLETDPVLAVAGFAADGKSALAEAARLQPDVVLVDLGLPATNGFELIEALTTSLPQARLVVVSGNNNAGAFARARQHGASGLATKSDPPEDLLTVVQSLMNGCDTAETPGVVAMLGDTASSLPSLTSREQELLNLLAQGLGVSDVARQLNISPATVRKHRENILRGLDVHNLVDAIRVARGVGLIAE